LIYKVMDVHFEILELYHGYLLPFLYVNFRERQITICFLVFCLDIFLFPKEEIEDEQPLE